MSSHFNYEIEERNMRNQLKELELTYKEEAWLNYEEYAKQFQSVNKAQLLPNFNFALNRTVILPVVFGGIIILFSFLLFNFINIKNTKTTNSDVAAMKAKMEAVVEQPKPEPKKAVAVPVKKEEPIIVKETPVNTNTIAALPNANTGNALIAKTLPAIQNNTSATNLVTTNTTALDAQTAKTATTYTFDPTKKKRRKKNTAEVLESIATPVSLPTVAQEEAEPELR